MEDKELQRILREKFANFSVDVPRDSWEALANQLPAVAPDDGWCGALSDKMAAAETPVPHGDWKQIEKRLPAQRKKRRIVPLWVWNTAEAAAVAAVASLLLVLPVAKYVSAPTETPAPQYSATHTLPTATDSLPTSAKTISKTDKIFAATQQRKRANAPNETAETQSESTKTENANLPISANKIEFEPIISDEKSAETAHYQQIDIAEAERLMAEQQQHFSESLAADTLPEHRQKKAKRRSDAPNEAAASAVNVGLLASLSPNISQIVHQSSTSIGGAHVGTRSTTRTTSRHDLPFTVGISVGIPLYERLDLQTGLNYSYAHSTFNKADKLRGINSERKQQLHYLGVPLMLSYRIVDKQVVKFYVSLGGACEKGLVADQQVKRFNADGVLLADETDHHYIEGVQGSLTANVGLGLCFYKGMSIYFEPGFTWYIPSTRYPQPPNLRTEHPYNLSLTAGLRFNVK